MTLMAQSGHGSPPDACPLLGVKADIFKVHGFSTANVFENVHFSREMSRTAIRALTQKYIFVAEFIGQDGGRCRDRTCDLSRVKGRRILKNQRLGRE
jgi:hypothetical protein